MTSRENRDSAAKPKGDETFPAPVYARTVLAPLFEQTKAQYRSEYAAINQAHLLMLVETEILSRSDGASIAGALAEIDALDHRDFTYTGEVEDYFFLVESELAKRIGIDLAGRLHTARSRNDMDHTIFRMKLKGHLDRLMEKSLALSSALIAKAELNIETLIVAYTHGQPAQPTTFAHYLGAAIEILHRDLQRLLDARATIDACPMGAAAITTTGFPIDRDRMATLLGFAAPLRNSYGCIATVDYVTATYSAVKLVFLHLGRLIQDFQFWTAFEVGQLHVPDGFVQISSIMPQKRNPVPIEHMRHLASTVIGQADIMLSLVHNTPFTDMNDSETLPQVTGTAAFETGARVLDLLAAFVAAVTIDGDRVRRTIDTSCVTITELADTLVRREGLSFRQAHEIAAKVAKGVVHRNVPLQQGYDLFTEAFRRTIERDSALPEPDFAASVSPENFVALRDRIGGPAPAAMNAALSAYQAEHERMASQAAALVAAVQSAAELRAAAFKELGRNGG